MNWRFADLAKRRAPILLRLMDIKEMMAWLEAVQSGQQLWGEGPWRWWKYAELGVEGGPFDIEFVVTQMPSHQSDDSGEIYRMKGTILDVLPLIQSMDELYLLVRKLGVSAEIKYPNWGTPITSSNMNNIWSWDDSRVLIGQTNRSAGTIDFRISPRWTVELPHFDNQIKLWDLAMLDSLKQARKHHSAFALESVLQLHPNGIEPYKD